MPCGGMPRGGIPRGYPRGGYGRGGGRAAGGGGAGGGGPPAEGGGGRPRRGGGEGRGGPAAAPATGMRQRAGLERVYPVPARLVQFEHAGLAAVDHLIEQAEKAESVDRAEGWPFGRATALVSLSLLEERHAPTTI